MFRAAYRSSSGALTVFAASGLHINVVLIFVKKYIKCNIWMVAVRPSYI